MPFYIRKSISVGPFRFNLSKSGIGVSAGVKGFRVGTGPRGNYIHVGRGGLYYRASLNSPRSDVHIQNKHKNHFDFKPNFDSHDNPERPDAEILEQGNVIELVDSNAKEIIDQINDKLKVISFWPVVLSLGALITLASLFLVEKSQLFFLLSAFLLLSTAALTYFIRQKDISRRKVVLMYDLEEDALESFQKITTFFDSLSSTSRSWNMISRNDIQDWKRNAGASLEYSRCTSYISYSTPDVISTNINVPSIVGGKHNIYFFPDFVLIIDHNKAGSISYKEISIDTGTTRFIENERVPPDAKVVDYTWKFVNKKGGPDRRFKNNQQLPICLYQLMQFRSNEGFNKLIHISNSNINLKNFTSAVKKHHNILTIK